MMKNLFKFSTLIVVMIAFAVIAGCRATGDTDDNSKKPEFIPEDKPLEPIEKVENKNFDPEDALTRFDGTDEELYTSFKYPSYWSLKKSPGMKVIPGVETVERWCKFRLESLDASIEVTVLEGVRDLDEMIPLIKKQILSRYALKSFLQAPPTLVEIDGVKADGAEAEEGEFDKVERKNSDDEENLPEFKYEENQTQPSTQPSKEENPDDETSNFFKENSNMFFMQDDDLNFDDDDDDDEGEDDDLNFDDDDDDEGEDDDLSFDDDDDDEGEDDDLGFDDDDDDEGDEVEEPAKDEDMASKIFKRNEVWLKGKEMWVQTQKINIDNSKLKLKALEYEGRFVYDQKLYLVKVFAVNRINDNRTYYSIFVCEAENFVRYEREYTKTVQSIRFNIPE